MANPTRAKSIFKSKSVMDHAPDAGIGKGELKLPDKLNNPKYLNGFERY